MAMAFGRDCGPVGGGGKGAVFPAAPELCHCAQEPVLRGPTAPLQRLAQVLRPGARRANTAEVREAHPWVPPSASPLGRQDDAGASAAHAPGARG